MLRIEPTRQSGFALLLVIWILAILAVIGAGIAAETHSESEIARNRLELAHARALAEAGVTMAVTWMSQPDVRARWRADGGTHTIRYGGGTISISVQDEGGKIDLNSAPIELIAGLLDALDLGADDARGQILNEVLARRQAVPNSLSTLNIAATGRLGGPPAAPTAAAFATNSELRQLDAVTHPIYDRLAPFITVYSKKPTISPMNAPREVLAAVPDLSPATIDFYLSARAAATIDQPLPSLGITAAKYLADSDANTVTIIARAETDSGVAFAREAVVSLGATSKPAFLEWRSAL